jgi:hypothetical protein
MHDHGGVPRVLLGRSDDVPAVGFGLRGNGTGRGEARPSGAEAEADAGVGAAAAAAAAAAPSLRGGATANICKVRPLGFPESSAHCGVACIVLLRADSHSVLASINCARWA